jgi:hypothetical protein
MTPREEFFVSKSESHLILIPILDNHFSLLDLDDEDSIEYLLGIYSHAYYIP